MKVKPKIMLSTLIVLMFSMPLWSSDLYHKGYDLMVNKKYCEAAETMEKAVPDYPDDFNLFYNIGYSYYFCKQMSKSITFLEKAISLTDKNEEIFKAAIMAGNAYINLRKPDHFKARNLFVTAIKANPKDFNASYFAGKVSMKLNDYSDAIKHFQKALTIKPNHSGTYLRMGLSYRKLNLIDKSIDALEKALKLNPNDDQAGLYLCLNYLEQQKYGDAKRAGLIAIKNTPKADLHSAYNYLGQAELALKEYFEAIKHFQKVLELAPGISSAYYNLGQTFESTKSYDKALSNYLEAHKRDPKNMDYLYKVGHAYELLKRDCEAVKWYKQCVASKTVGDACRERMKWAQERCDRSLEER